jgi:hypothetical protein
MRDLRPTLWLDETGYHDHEDGTLRLLGRTIGEVDASLPPDAALSDLLRALCGLASRWGVAARHECRGLNKNVVEGGCPFNHACPSRGALPRGRRERLGGAHPRAERVASGLDLPVARCRARRDLPLGGPHGQGDGVRPATLDIGRVDAYLGASAPEVRHDRGPRRAPGGAPHGGAVPQPAAARQRRAALGPSAAPRGRGRRHRGGRRQLRPHDAALHGAAPGGRLRREARGGDRAGARRPLRVRRADRRRALPLRRRQRAPLPAPVGPGRPVRSSPSRAGGSASSPRGRRSDLFAGPARRCASGRSTSWTRRRAPTTTSPRW